MNERTNRVIIELLNSICRENKPILKEVDGVQSITTILLKKRLPLTDHE